MHATALRGATPRWSAASTSSWTRSALSFFQRRKLAPAAFHSCFDTSRTSAGAPSRLALSAWSRSRNALPAGRVAASGGPSTPPSIALCFGRDLLRCHKSRCFVLIAHRTRWRVCSASAARFRATNSRRAPRARAHDCSASASGASSSQRM